MDLTMSYGENLPRPCRRCHHRDQMLSWNGRPRCGYVILPVQGERERQLRDTVRAMATCVYLLHFGRFVVEKRFDDDFANVFAINQFTQGSVNLGRERTGGEGKRSIDSLLRR